MDTGDIIIIEDTPPSSPVKTNKQKPVASKPTKFSKPSSQPNMYYQPQNQEFPVAEQAMIWSRNTTNFIKQSMNSVQQNNRMPLMNSMQNKPMGAQIRGFPPRNGYQLGGFPRPPYNIYNYDPFVNSYYQMNNYGPSYLNNIYNQNFWMKVKLEELPEKGEIVSQYYLDQAETPIKLTSNQNDATPEFIDINTLASKMHIQNNVTTNENTLNLSTEIDDKKRKNPVPLFLKRNRPTNSNKMKITEDGDPLNLAISKVPTNSNNNKEDEDDIVFIGEFKREEPHLQTSDIEIKNEFSATDNNSSQDSSKEETSFKFGKRKRRNRTTLIPLRRNPKRQVQIEKDFLKMIDDVIMESDKEEKLKKNYSGKSKPAKTAIKQCRRSPRNLTNSGAVYNPPSPLTTAHIREWPAEGMHERPEYDPVSGKILPFDSSIRNISIQFNKAKSDTNDQDLNNEFHLENIDTENNFPELCHEMLHHVLAYVTTVKMLDREEKKESEEKMEFLQQLNLHKNKERIENQICDILHSIVDDVTSKEEKSNDPMTNALTDLLTNTILFYCLTNNVDKTDVAKYIASVQPEDIIKLSNEQFNLLSKYEN